jgi:DNA-binding FadR family transcriptional regulator
MYLGMEMSEPGSSSERRRYLVVAEEVLKAVAVGNLTVGDRLPNERALAEQFGVSRSTVREALFALELGGVIQVRPGSGYFLTGAGIQTESQPPLAGTSPRHLVEVRGLLEPAVARHCAQEISRADVERLSALVDDAERAGLGSSQDSIDRYLALNFDFHLELAQTCGNPLLAGLIGQLLGTGKHPLWLLMNGIVVRDPAIRTQQVAEHRAILWAIADGRGEEAGEAMAAHLGALSARVFGSGTGRLRVTRSRRRRSA